MFIKKLLRWLGFGKPITPASMSCSSLTSPINSGALPGYFGMSWVQRKQQMLDRCDDTFQSGFATANSAQIAKVALEEGADAQLHVIFNLGAASLTDYLRTDDYKNAYERPKVGSRHLEPSPTRCAVDSLLGLEPAHKFYFCAASVGGTGIRFYGEYCAVLKSPVDKHAVRGGLDRNSYDLVRPPLDLLTGGPDSKRYVDSLKFKFRQPEFADMLTIKVLQHQAMRPRLMTIGNIGQAVLSDEDYVELFHEGKILPDTILEVRSHPEDEMTETSIRSRHRAEGRISPEQLLWVQHRQYARKEMDKKGIKHRMVSGNGRAYRWG